MIDFRHTLRTPSVSGHILDVFRRGTGACWLWLCVSWSLGYVNWNPDRPAVLFDATGVRVPWPETAWLPVWSPFPGQGLLWLLGPIGLGALWLLAGRPHARPVAGGMLVLGLWVGGADRMTFHYHHYLIVLMLGVVLLLPAGRRDERVSHLDCLPVVGLTLALWGWSAIAKWSSDWPVLWALQLRDFGPPPVDAAVTWLLAALPTGTTIWIGSSLTALAELYVALHLCVPRFTRSARYLAFGLCAGFALVAPLFAISVGVLTWTTGRYVDEAARGAPVRDDRPTPARGAHVRHLLAVAFVAFLLFVPLRAYLSPNHARTHHGYYWAWRQMADLLPGHMRIHTWDPARLAWRDLTDDWLAGHHALPVHFAFSPCEIGWALTWLSEHHPHLVPTDQPLLLSLQSSDPPLAPVPDECAHTLPPHVVQAGSTR